MFATTGEVKYEGPTGKQTREEIEAAMSKLTPGTIYHDGLEYYGITRANSNSVGRNTTVSLMELMTWDATSYADLISCPLLIMSGSRSYSDYISREISREAYIKATAAPEKESII